MDRQLEFFQGMIVLVQPRFGRMQDGTQAQFTHHKRGFTTPQVRIDPSAVHAKTSFHAPGRCTKSFQIDDQADFINRGGLLDVRRGTAISVRWLCILNNWCRDATRVFLRYCLFPRRHLFLHGKDYTATYSTNNPVVAETVVSSCCRSSPTGLCPKVYRAFYFFGVVERPLRRINANLGIQLSY